MALKLTKIKETCLYVSDLQTTRDFYEGKLGLDCFTFSEGNHAFFRAGASVLLCFLPEVSKVKTSIPPHYGTGFLHFAFETKKEDYESCKDVVTRAGISIEHEETWRSGHKSFYFRDPDNHCVEIIEAGMWEA